MTPTWSATASASSWSCVTKTAVVPTSSWIRRISSRSCVAHPGVEGGQRLVEQEHAGADGERASERDPLLLAAGHLPGVAPRERRQADELERLAGAAAALAGTHAAHPQAERDIVQRGQVREQAVRLEHHAHVALARRDVGDVPPVDQDPAAVDVFQACEGA